MMMRMLSSILLVVSPFFLCVVLAVEDSVHDDGSYESQFLSNLELFHYHEDVRALGPNVFPLPTDYHHLHAQPYLKPAHGEHRPDQDALVAYAAEYPLMNYVVFIESLRATGYTGDIVLAVSPLDRNKKDVWEYLTEPGNHVVLYTPVLACFNAEGEAVDSAKGGSRVCQTDNVFGKDGSPIPDPRPPRTVQTLRYEIYWLMILAYQPHSWIMLVDVRDTVFQSNPFTPVPRTTTSTENQESGLLYFFGENAQATRLGQSKHNRKWLSEAYGERVADLLAKKPTICSGATLGEQVALEMYIRAMVAESDATGVVLVGADQGFHNFLHYSHKLSNADAIHSIVVFDQGQGIVNNMGAMRTKPLDEWGNGKCLLLEVNEKETNPKKKNRYTVLNWDGVVSPVVHQYDRHKQLSDFFYKVQGAELMDAWKVRKAKLYPSIASS